MLSFGQMLTLAFVLVVSPSFAATSIYTYKDDSGTPTFTTDLDSIPEKYRSRAAPLDSDTSSPVEAGVLSPPPVAVRVVTVLDQQVSTRLEGETVVIHADLTAQVDPNEVAQAITALREDESAKQEL